MEARNLTTIALVVLVILKLANIIAWSWLWVLLPLWLPIAIYLIGWIGIGIIMIVGYIYNLLK